MKAPILIRCRSIGAVDATGLTRYIADVEKIMLKKMLTPLVAALMMSVSVGALAQSNAGKLAGVRGIVTVNDGKNAFSGINNSGIRDGFTIATGSGGSAGLITDSGCAVSLKANQSLLVAPGSCQQLAAAVKNTDDKAVAALTPLGAIVGGAFFLITANEIRKVNKLSPS